MSWPLFFAIIVLAFVVVYVLDRNQTVIDECDGEVARGYWNQPICIEEDRR